MDVPGGLDSFLDNLSSFLLSTARLEATSTRAMAEQTVYKLENYIHVLRAIAGTLEDEDIEQLSSILFELIKDLQDILSKWLDMEVGINPDRPYVGLQAEKHHCGGRGRPKYIIQPEQLVFLRDIRFTWTRIASLYGISSRTLYNIRCELGLLRQSFDSFSQISDADLLEEVCVIKRVMPEAGQNIVRGSLEARNIHVQMTRIQNCISQVDPINTALRWAAPRKRRVYSVPHPNALWHIDGNHKLVRLVCGNHNS